MYRINGDTDVDDIRNHISKNKINIGVIQMEFKKSLKYLLPKPILICISNIRNLYRLKRTPKFSKYKGNLKSVLQCKIAYNEFGGYCIPLNAYMHSVPQTIYNGRVWERVTTEFIISHLGNGDIIHAGTFFGDSLPAISNVNKDYITWAFEPNPESFRCAVITKLINNLENVELFNKGLGARQSIEKMKIMDDDYDESMGGGSRIASKAKKYSESTLIDVEIVTIDHVIPADRKIAIIHLDIEGFETEALAGAIETIKRCKPILIIETTPDDTWLSNNLLNIGYTLSNKLIDQNTVLYPPLS